MSMQQPPLTFGNRDVVWEVKYIPFGLPVVAIEFDSHSATLTGCLMPTVAGSNAKLDWKQKIRLPDQQSYF